MIRKEHQGFACYQFPLLADLPVSHGVITGLNLKDQENLQRIKETFSLPSLYSANQTHGQTIVAVTAATPVMEGDILTTSCRNLPLLMKHADCQIGLLYDPCNHAISTVHCGWRGSVQNVYAIAIGDMVQRYGTKPENLLVCISPSLGPESAEFIHYRTELPADLHRFQIKSNYFDFWAITRFQLTQCGVLEERIEIAGIDTYTHDDFFSHRRRDKPAGRNGTFAYLLPR